ncbi:sensor histidine kinase [Pinibacter soli]|uniref:Histidine kinase n=1 Tax=Pinibacter soli TaxID=3044211 RepID=A0ABT6RG30_9BACT|nr:sensor histidine kinase [Pinibacter soli]MDI3321517.1 histidine kinase [Pinibacter soli]
MKLNISVILVHFIGWILFLSLPVLFFAGYNNGNGIGRFLFSWEYWLYFTFYCSLFYVHTFALLPRLYFAGKKIWYALILIALFFLTLTLRPFDLLTFKHRPFNDREMMAGERQMFRERREPPQMHGEPGEMPPPDFNSKNMQPMPPNGFGQRRVHIDIVSLFLYFLIIALSLALEISRRLAKAEQKLIATESEKARAELSFLKAQINPHFLFNTLNNIYSLSLLKNEKTPDAIMKLSNIMRYVTDDVHEDFVPLKEELDCIADYIYLQQLRLGKNVQLCFKITGDSEDREIAPLLLMTFIENVFKHGVSSHETSVLTIHLTVEETQLVFTTHNKIFLANEKLERIGQGIENATKRLQLLYPDKHSLQIGNANGYYDVKLTLQFSE